MPVIGFLHPTWPEPNADRLRAFSQGLKEAGLVEGAAVRILSQLGTLFLATGIPHVRQWVFVLGTGLGSR